MEVICQNPLKKTFGERKPCTFADCKPNSEGNSGVSGTCYAKDENGTDVNMCPRPGTTFKGAAQICAQCNFDAGKAFCPEVMGDPTCDTDTGSFKCATPGTKVTSQQACGNYAFNGYRKYTSEQWTITEYENSGEKQLTAEENAAAVNSSINAPSKD